MAKSGSQGHALGTSALPPGADIWPRSAQGTCTERIDSRWLQGPAIIYSGIGTKAETGVRNGRDRARDLNLQAHLSVRKTQPPRAP